MDCSCCRFRVSLAGKRLRKCRHEPSFPCATESSLAHPFVMADLPSSQQLPTPLSVLVRVAAFCVPLIHVLIGKPVATSLTDEAGVIVVGLPHVLNNRAPVSGTRMSRSMIRLDGNVAPGYRERRSRCGYGSRRHKRTTNRHRTNPIMRPNPSKRTADRYDPRRTPGAARGGPPWR